MLLSNRHTMVANSLDYALVHVHFAEAAVEELFAALLDSRGVPVLRGAPVGEKSGSALLITEPQYFATLPETLRSRTLVVTERANAPAGCHHVLPRPLTERGVEVALDRFLRSNAAGDKSTS